MHASHRLPRNVRHQLNLANAHKSHARAGKTTFRLMTRLQNFPLSPCAPAVCMTCTARTMPVKTLAMYTGKGFSAPPSPQLNDNAVFSGKKMNTKAGTHTSPLHLKQRVVSCRKTQARTFSCWTSLRRPMVPSLIFLDRKRDVASDEDRSSARTCESTPPLFFAASRRFVTPCRKVLFVCRCCGTFMHLVKKGN